LLDLQLGWQLSQWNQIPSAGSGFAFLYNLSNLLELEFQKFDLISASCPGLIGFIRLILQIILSLAASFQLGWFPYNYILYSSYSVGSSCDNDCQASFLINLNINYNILCVVIPLIVLSLIIDLEIYLYMVTVYFKIVKKNTDAVPRSQVLSNMIAAVSLEDSAVTKTIYVPASIATQLKSKTLTYE